MLCFIPYITHITHLYSNKIVMWLFIVLTVLPYKLATLCV